MSVEVQWYNHQPEEIRASKLIGTSVKNDAGERIGEINEVVLADDGKVAAVVIGVGGFLGIGEREVAVNFGSLRLAKDSDGDSAGTRSADRDLLKSAPEWKWSGDSTEGRSGSTPAPAGPLKRLQRMGPATTGRPHAFPLAPARSSRSESSWSCLMRCQ